MNRGVHHALVDPVGKAAEGCRSPRRCARHDAIEITPPVLECSSPLELWPDSAWPAIPHAARRLPKPASDGHAATGEHSRPGCGWPRPRGKLRASARDVPCLVPRPRRVSDEGVADCARGRARSPNQFRTPHAAFRNQRLTGTLQGAGEWRGNESQETT
jgi:hypothetical protein